MSTDRAIRARDDRGEAMVIWCLGLAILLLPLGGLSVDLWHSISAERALQAAASAAATAGASGLDTAAYRDSSVVKLDPATAENLALASLGSQVGLAPLSGPPAIVVGPSDETITVQLHETVQLTLLRLLLGGRAIHLTATAVASPRASGAP